MTTTKRLLRLTNFAIAAAAIAFSAGCGQDREITRAKTTDVLRTYVAAKTGPICAKLNSSLQTPAAQNALGKYPSVADAIKYGLAHDVISRSDSEVLTLANVGNALILHVHAEGDFSSITTEPPDAPELEIAKVKLRFAIDDVSQLLEAARVKLNGALATEAAKKEIGDDRTMAGILKYGLSHDLISYKDAQMMALADIADVTNVGDSRGALYIHNFYRMLPDEEEKNGKQDTLDRLGVK